MQFEAVIGLEIHAELLTRSKMFCACEVVDVTEAHPNTAVCPVCSGMPGTLPVVNRRAVEYALRVALALECQIARRSIFARKNYFYPDLPKGYQISQYEQPLAQRGRLQIETSQGERIIRVRRVHLEEDTCKLTHVDENGSNGGRTLVNMNRAGVPLLEIVSEPDLHTAEEVRAYAANLRSILRYLGVSSGDMQKGVLRIEPNVSVRPVGEETFGTRTEIKNLNSFRALERSVNYEIKRQVACIKAGERVIQQTMGWDENREVTIPQRSKEEAHDYRYFPEPDLPPLVVDDEWLQAIREQMPELPAAKLRRYRDEYDLSAYDAEVLTAEPDVAAFFEQTAAAISPAVGGQSVHKIVANWVSGELFGLLNQAGVEIAACRVRPEALAALIGLVQSGEINQITAKKVLSEMFESGKSADQIVSERGLRQVSDAAVIVAWVKQVLAENPEQVDKYINGKETLKGWFFGQVMRLARGKADPQVVQAELGKRLSLLQNKK